MFSYYKETDNVIKRMAGAVVLEVGVEDDHLFSVKTDRGTAHFEAEGDCCSYSFFLNASDLHVLVGKTLTSVVQREEIDGVRDRSKDEECTQEESSWYGCDFNYIGGSVYIEMRNDSNGYYGGLCNVHWEPAGPEKGA